MDSGRGPLTVAVDGWTACLQHGLPAVYGAFRQHALLCEEIDLADSDGASCFLAVTAAGGPWPQLVVAQRYSPAAGEFDPGIALVPQTAVLFAGAGTRLLAYSLRGHPQRLWEDTADMGFWHWQVHGPVVIMAAELELAAWDLHAVKLWSLFVEPPWSYEVTDGQIHLDVMGHKTQFPALSGPGHPPLPGA
jgi:hypothetical protein